MLSVRQKHRIQVVDSHINDFLPQVSSKQLKTTHAPASSYFTPAKEKPRETLFPVRSEIKETFKL